MSIGLHIASAPGKVAAMIPRPLFLIALCAFLSACAQSGGTPAAGTASPVIPEASQNGDDDLNINAPIRVAAVLPLSGPEARLGDALAKAIELAFFEASDPRLELRFFDSAGSNAAPESRAFLVKDVAAYDPAAVLGPLFSDNAQAVAPVMLDRGVPVLSFSNDVSANAAGAILLGQQPEQEIARVLAYVADQLETRRIGMILPDDVYGSRVAAAADATVQALNETVRETYEADVEAYEEALAALQETDGFFEGDLLGTQPDQPTDVAPTFTLGAVKDPFAADVPEDLQESEPQLEEVAAPVFYQVTVRERYPRDLRAIDIPARRVAEFYRREAEVAAEREFLTELGDPIGLDYLDYIRNIDTFGQPRYDAIVVAEGGQMLRALAPLLNVYSVDEEEIQFIGTGLWNDPGLSREPALHGGLFATAASPAGNEFEQLYVDSYGQPAPPIASLAYDAMAMTALAARDDKGAPTVFNPARLFAEAGYSGASGLLRILPSGITQRTLAVKQVTESGLIEIDGAPQSFAPYERQQPDNSLDNQDRPAAGPLSR